VKDVRALIGGFQGWAGAKYPVVVGDRPR